MSSDIEESTTIRNVFENVPITDESVLVKNDFKLRDISREVYLSSCGDCHREHLNGEHVVWSVPSDDKVSMRTVWEGCVDCYIRRTNPHGKEAGGS